MKAKRSHKKIKKVVIFTLSFLLVILSIPIAFSYILNTEDKIKSTGPEPFPVTVDFINKVIIDDPAIEAYLQSTSSPFQASVINSGSVLKNILSFIIFSFSNFGSNRNLALVGGDKFIKINPGLRKEEIVSLFGNALSWTSEERKDFVTTVEGSTLPFKEGSYYPAIYAVNVNATPLEVQNIINQKFSRNIMSRYSTSTAEKVPLEIALTVASLIQRETIGTRDMRLVSGIIWNRIFSGMPLQLDATLQYAKANTNKTQVWWPKVEPQDKYIKSPYNTYMHSGLPPTPIANPSLAALLAALNPLITECIFYFHDKKGGIHCSSTYENHVALLKQYYGRGR